MCSFVQQEERRKIPNKTIMGKEKYKIKIIKIKIKIIKIMKMKK